MTVESIDNIIAIAVITFGLLVAALWSVRSEFTRDDS